MDNISQVILGGKGGLHSLIYAPTHRDHLPLGDKGFAERYQDGGNQLNHAWYAVHLGYTSGRLGVVERYSTIHENPNIPVFGGGRVAIPNPFGKEIVLLPGGGASQLDHELSMSGGSLGVQIRQGALDVTRVGDWIRENWGLR